MALISEYLAADLSAVASADALGRINIGNLSLSADIRLSLTMLCKVDEHQGEDNSKCSREKIIELDIQTK